MRAWPAGGVVPPMITPLRPDHSIDIDGVIALVKAHASACTSRGRAGMTATAIGGMKTALVQIGLIEHAIMSPPMSNPSAELREHVAHHLALFPPDIIGSPHA